MNLALGLNQIAKLFVVNGRDKTYVVEGPMGSGKSNIHKVIQKMVGDMYNYVTVDCTQWDVGDVQIPDIDREMQVIRFLPNVLLVGDRRKPMFINLDEIGKASRPVQNALLPVMLEKRVGAVPLPIGSIVCGTTNLGQEGVGDLFQAHARNRVSFLEMRYPTNTEWIEWGLDNGVTAIMLRFAEENPQLFHSFKQHPKPDTNPDIFHPAEQRRSFVTPRSLFLADVELRDDRREAINDDDATLAGIAGNIGEHAARNLMAFVHLYDKLARWTSIVTSPMTAKLPEDNPAALYMQMYKCIHAVEESTLDAVLTYVMRMPKELQGVFCSTVMRTNKGKWVAQNRKFTTWAVENAWLVR